MLFSFKNQSYAHILKLCEQINNNPRHRGIYSEKPIFCHFDTHISSIVAKKNIESFQNQQKQIKNIFKPGTDLSVGDRVLLRKRKWDYEKDKDKREKTGIMRERKIKGNIRSSIRWTKSSILRVLKKKK